MQPLILTPGVGDNPPTATLYYGQDVKETLRTLPEASIHTVCTSPPYWGLRDYGADGQIGLEETPEAYVQALVDVFREVKRVLRSDGTLWVNLGDSYAGGGRAGKNPEYQQRHTSFGKLDYVTVSGGMGVPMPIPEGLKPKDLVGIPWRVAFALQADGWYLRSDIIWSKRNCMPESVTDRPTKAHEYIFLFAHPDSDGKYFYDMDAIREPLAQPTSNQVGPGGRNKRSVWEVNPKPYKGSHFAVWPPELVRPMILAGTSSYGVCGTCKSPWKRVSTSSDQGNVYGVGGGPKAKISEEARLAGGVGRMDGGRRAVEGSTFNNNPLKRPAHTISAEWEATCTCDPTGVVPATVLDVFSGSATTGLVALQEGRHYIGTDINSEYLALAEARVRGEAPPQKSVEVDGTPNIFDLFSGASRE